jgi:hypothetical protein
MAGMTSIISAIVRAIDAGLLREDDPTLTAVTMWTAVHGLVSLRLAKPGLALPPIHDLLDRCLDRNLDGLRR